VLSPRQVRLARHVQESVSSPGSSTGEGVVVIVGSGQERASRSECSQRSFGDVSPDQVDQNVDVANDLFEPLELIVDDLVRAE
jgi:hypothetical protein